MIYIFIGVHPVPSIHFWITFWSLIRFYSILLSFYISILNLVFNRYILIRNAFLMAHWSVPPLSCFIFSDHCFHLLFGFGFWTLPVHWPLPLSFYFFSGLTLLSHWTVPPFLFLSVCLCLYYSTFFLIVNTFFEKKIKFFYSSCFIDFIFEFSENSDDLSVIFCLAFAAGTM